MDLSNQWTVAGANNPHVPADIVIVHSNATELARLATVLAAAGHRVRLASSFEEAKQVLAGPPPGLLVTALRLGSFNGLHLVLRTMVTLPQMRAIVIDTAWDPGLEAEARACGAIYLADPVAAPVLLARVAEALGSLDQPLQPAERRWPRKSVPPGLMATVAVVEATLTDVSYGGLRFEVRPAPEGELPRTVEVHVPGVNLGVHAEVVWADHSRPDRTVYGAAISEAEPNRVRAWQGFVDTVT